MLKIRKDIIGRVEKEHGADIDIQKEFGLATDELRVFGRAHKSFYAAQGTERKKERGLDKITKIKRNHKEKCFDVYFKDGDWYKFFTNGTWG